MGESWITNGTEFPVGANDDIGSVPVDEVWPEAVALAAEIDACGDCAEREPDYCPEHGDARAVLFGSEAQEDR